MVKDFKKIRKNLEKYIEPILITFFCYIYDPITEHQVIEETRRIVDNYLKSKYPKFPQEYIPQFRIRRGEDKSKMVLQTQEYFNDLKGWKYIGTIEIPPNGEIHDIYLRHNFGTEDFTLMTKFGHDRNKVHIGGYRAAAEHEAQVMSPLAIAYDYALSEGEI